MYGVVFAASCHLTRFISSLTYGSKFLYSFPETLYLCFSLKENFRLEMIFQKLVVVLASSFLRKNIQKISFYFFITPLILNLVI